LTDTEGIALGPIYQLSPEGSSFAQPATLTWQLSNADLGGHTIADLVIATREQDGGWTRQPARRDGTAKTVQVSAAHFSGWVATWEQYLPNFSISPEQANVMVTASLPLKIKLGYREHEDDDLAAPGPKASPDNGVSDDELLAPPIAQKPSPDNAADSEGVSDDDLLAPPAAKPKTPHDPPRCTNWRVNGTLGRNSTWGTVHAGNNDTATFVAPSKIPSRNPAVVSCDAFYKRSKVVALANITIKDRATGWRGSFEYTYSESHSTTAKTVAGVDATSFGTESRKVTGKFNATTDSMGWGTLGDTGTGHAEVTKTYGMRNPICGTDCGSTIAGDVKVDVGGSAGSGAGSVSIRGHSDNLDGEQHLDDSCSKQHPHQSSKWNAAFGAGCEFVGIDFTRNGTYEADVPSDNGKGRCKLTISPQ